MVGTRDGLMSMEHGAFVRLIWPLFRAKGAELPHRYETCISRATAAAKCSCIELLACRFLVDIGDRRISFCLNYKCLKSCQYLSIGGNGQAGLSPRSSSPLCLDSMRDDAITSVPLPHKYSPSTFIRPKSITGLPSISSAPGKFLSRNWV